MKRIKFIRGQLQRKEILQIHMRKIPLNACGNWWWLCLYPLVSSACCDRSLMFFLSPLQSLCHALSSRVIIIPLLGDDFSHLCPLSAARPGCPVPLVVEGWHSEDNLSTHSMGREQGWGHLRANPRFGVFWFIPPGSLSSNNLLYRENFLLSVLSRLGLSSEGVGGCAPPARKC